MYLGNSKGLSAGDDILLLGKITQTLQLQKPERLRDTLQHFPACCDQILVVQVFFCKHHMDMRRKNAIRNCTP